MAYNKDVANKANSKYRKEHIKEYKIRFHNENEKEIINYLNSLENKTAFIKEAIIEKIEKENKRV